MPTAEPFHPPAPEILPRPDGSTIAYYKIAPGETKNKGPGLVFLGGFMSDMTGTKAMALDAFAAERGRAFVRFDYLGHGASSGHFEDGTIGRWAEDAIAVLDNVAEGPQILVGSSMGGWIMLLAALARPERIAGLIGLAAAPDFTETLLWQKYSPEIRETLKHDGVYYAPSDYGEEPYPITMTLIEEARAHLLMDKPIPITCPVRLIHGTADADVPCQVSFDLKERLESRDVEVTLVEGGDHRQSKPDELTRLCNTVAELSDRLS